MLEIIFEELLNKNLWHCEICNKKAYYLTSNIKAVSKKSIPFAYDKYSHEEQFILCNSKKCIEYLKLLAC